MFKLVSMKDDTEAYKGDLHSSSCTFLIMLVKYNLGRSIQHNFFSIIKVVAIQIIHAFFQSQNYLTFISYYCDLCMD